MHRFHVLLVDDHENILFTFRMALECDGYGVDTAASIPEARAKMEERHYDVLILDLRLGVESGLTLLADLRLNEVDVPVLMMTAHGTAEDAVTAMKLGAVDFLEKPLSLAHFRTSVAEVLQRRLSSEDKPPTAGDQTCERQIIEARHALNCRDLAAARLHLTRALELNSHSADAHYLFGSMLELNNHPARAKRYYHRALQLYAERSFARASLSLHAPPRAATEH